MRKQLAGPCVQNQVHNQKAQVGSRGVRYAKVHAHRTSPIRRSPGTPPPRRPRPPLPRDPASPPPASAAPQGPGLPAARVRPSEDPPAVSRPHRSSGSRACPASGVFRPVPSAAQEEQRPRPAPAAPPSQVHFRYRPRPPRKRSRRGRGLERGEGNAPRRCALCCRATGNGR